MEQHEQDQEQTRDHLPLMTRAQMKDIAQLMADIERGKARKGFEKLHEKEQ